jgi:energy-converting hydrogenase Eha subunit H
LNRVTVYTVERIRTNTIAAERGDTMTTIYGMMAMMPLLFGSAGYILVSAGGTAEYKGCKTDE